MGKLEPSRELHRLLVLVCGGVAWAGATVGMIAGREFIGAWISPEYFAGYPVLLLSMLSMAAVGFISASQGAGMAWGKVREVYFLAVGEAAIKVILSLVLVRYIDEVGVALATLLPQVFLSLVLLPKWICSLLGDSTSFYYSSMLKGAALFAAIAVAGREAVAALNGGLWTALAMGCLGGALYLVVFTSMILQPPERRRLIGFTQAAIQGAVSAGTRVG